MAYVKQITTTENQTYDLKSKVTNGIPYGECNSTSTATAFTATVDGLDALYDGACVMLKNGVVTSAANFTININNLGAKPCYNNMATGNDITPTAPTRDTTIFNINYTMLFVYSEDIVDGGGWICYRGYDGNTNTIGYQLRTNSSNLVAADTGYRYRIWLTSADGKKWVPINTSTSTNSTTARSLNTRAIDPFGPIVYRATNGTCNSGAGLGATGIWQQYTLTIGYSYVLTLTYPAPVYLRCTPQSDGSAVMNDIVQALPSTNDGKIYIFLGVAYSATAMELQAYHPVYWHDGTGIRIWTGVAGGSSITVDSALSSTSENPVQNKVINSALNGKVDTLITDVEDNTLKTQISNQGYQIALTANDNTAKTRGRITVSPYSTLLDMYDSNARKSMASVQIGDTGDLFLSSSDGTNTNQLMMTGITTTIHNVITPTDNGDAVPKSYVDNGLSGKQTTLVSGTNIKTVNNNSLLGSGNISLDTLPSVSASDNDKVLTVVSGAWAAATPSGGSGVSYIKTSVTLAVSDWSNNICPKSVQGVTANNDVLVTYAPASKSAYTAADIYCMAQATGTLTFACTTTPTSAITVNVMIFDGGVTPEYAIQNNSTVVTVASSASAGSTVAMTCIGSGYVQAVTLENVIVLDTAETVSGQTITFTMPGEAVVVRNAFGTGTASGGSASISFDNLYLPEGAKKITIMRTSGGDN